MKNDNVVQIKSYAFAVRIVKVYQFLSNEKKEFVLSKAASSLWNFNWCKY